MQFIGSSSTSASEPKSIPVIPKQKSFGKTLKKKCSKIINVLSLGTLANPPPLNDKHIIIIQKHRRKKLLALPEIKLEIAQPGVMPEPLSNKSLEGMRNLTKGIVNFAVRNIQEKYIAERVQQINTEAPRFLKDRFKDLIILGGQKPIFEIIKNLKANDTTLEKFYGMLQKALKGINPEDKDTLKKEFSERIKAFPSEKSPQDAEKDEEKLNTCRDKVLDWVFNINHNEPQSQQQSNNNNAQPNTSFKNPYNLFEGDSKPSEELIKRVMQTTVQFLGEKQISIHEERFRRTLHNDLPAIVENSIQQNAMHITDLLSKRMAEVIDTLPNDQFTDLFDKIVKILGEQVLYLIESHEFAEQAGRDHLSLKKYAQSIVARPYPENVNERNVYIKCQSYLDALALKGEGENDIPQLKKEILFKSFLSFTLNEGASTDNKITENISNLILKTLLPDITKDGKKINGLENLLSNIKIPDEFVTLFKESQDIAELFVDKDQYHHIEEFLLAASGFKELFLEVGAEIIKFGLKEAIEHVVKQMSNPKELILVLSDSALPQAKETMFKYFADDLIRENVDLLAPYIRKLPEKEAEEYILNFLFQKISSAAHEYKFGEIDRPIFNRVVLSRIKDIVETINYLIKKHPKKADPSVSSIIAIIKEYYNSKKTNDNNPYFANFIDAALSTNEFGSLLTFLFNFKFIRNIVSKLITRSVQSFRKEYRPGLNLVISAARDKYLNEEIINELTTYKPSIESLEEDILESEEKIRILNQENFNDNNNNNDVKTVEKINKRQKIASDVLTMKTLKEKIKEDNLKHNTRVQKAPEDLQAHIQSLTSLGYDMLMFKATHIPFGQYFMKKILGPSRDKTYRVALTLFNKILSHQAFNEHLLNKIFLTAVTAIDNPDTLQDLTVPGPVPVSAQSIKTDLMELKIHQPIPEEPSLWKRIANSVVRIFKAFIKLFHSKKMVLSNRQLELIESLTPKTTISPNKTRKSATISRNVTQVEVQEAQISESQDQDLPEEISELNSSLKKVGDFVSQFTQKISDETFTTKIKPHITLIKNGACKVLDQTEQILELINRFSKPSIIKKIETQGYKFEIDKASQSFFNVYFSALRDENGHVVDLTKMITALKNVNNKVLAEDVLETYYIKPICDWLSQEKNPIKPLYRFVDKNFVYDKTMDKFYIAAIQWLIKHKIQCQAKQLKSLFEFEADISNMIKEHLDSNSQHLAMGLFNRIAGHINNITDEQYKSLFDKCANDVNSQLENLIKAENAIKDMLPEVNEDNNNIDAEQQKIREKLPKELTAKDEEDKPLYALNSSAQKLLQSPEQENILILQLVERMINLALPTEHKKVQGGQLKDVDAFQELLHKISIDPKITYIIADFRQSIKLLLPEKYVEKQEKKAGEPEKYDKFDTVENTIRQVVETFILNIIKKHTTTILTEKLREIIKLISDTKMRNEFLADNFSLIQKQLFKASANLIISKLKKAEKIKLFQMIINQENGKIPPKLIDQLHRLSLVPFKETTKIELGVSSYKFEKHYLSDILDELCSHLFKKFMFSDEFVTALAQHIETPDDPTTLDALRNLLKKFTCSNLKEDSSLFKSGESFNKRLDSVMKPIINQLTEKRNTIQRIDPNAKWDEEDVYSNLEQYFEGEFEGVNNQNELFIQLLINIIKMGKYTGKYREAAINLLTKIETAKNGLTAILVRALHPIRDSTIDVIDLVVPELNRKYLDNTYIENLVTPQSLEILNSNKKNIENELNRTIGDLKHSNLSTQQQLDKPVDLQKELDKVNIKIAIAQEKHTAKLKREENIPKDFEKGLKITSDMLYDLITYSAQTQGSWLGWGANKITKAFLGTHEKLNLVINEFYTKFFDNEDLNKALVMTILDNALTSIETKP